MRLMPTHREEYMTEKTIVHASIAALALAACLASASPLLAETVTMKANLTAAAEVPPNDSAATGAVTATFDTASKKLSWQGTYAGLSGPPTAGPFHGPAEPGKNAGVAVPIAPTASPFQGAADLTDAQAADLLAGKYYVNIHTEAHKGGEIRGQLTK
jgi:hypothetical protein